MTGTQNKLKIGILSSLVMISIAIVGCGQKSFQSATGTNGPTTVNTFVGNENDNTNPNVPTDTGGPNCRDQLNQITVPVKVHFIVDVSGSNRLSQDGVAPTDPQKSIRGGSIQSFVNTYAAKPNFRWGFEVFANSSASNFITGGSGTPIFGDSASMSMALAQFNNTKDDGATPYAAAINEAAELLSNELSKNSTDTKYIFVFLSDGMPTPMVSNSSLQQMISNLTSMAPGRVSFNTVYYGQSSQDSYNRLKMMAQVGGGNFLDTNVNTTGTAFMISDLVIVPGVVCNK